MKQSFRSLSVAAGVILFLLLGMMLFPGFSSRGETDARTRGEVVEAFGNNKAPVAQTAVTPFQVESALSRNPRNGELYCRLAEIAMEGENFRDALHHLSLARLFGAATARHLLLQGLILERMGHLDLAAQSYGKAIDADSIFVLEQCPVIWLNSFIAQFGPDISESSFESRKINSRYLPVLYSYLGWLQGKEGNTARSLKSSTLAEMLSPSMPLPKYNTGLALLRRGDFEDAFRAYEMGLQADRNQFFHHLALEALYDLEQEEFSADVLNCFLCLMHLETGDELQAIRLLDDTRETAQNKGILKLLHDKLSPARKHYDKKLLQSVLTLWERYEGTLGFSTVEGDTVWNREELSLYHTFDWQAESLRRRGFNPARLKSVLRVIVDRDGAILLQVRWRDASNHYNHVFTTNYLLVKESGSYRLANPLYLMTKGWRYIEYGNFVIHTPSLQLSGGQEVERLAASLGGFLAHASKELGLPLPNRIDYYLFPKDEDPLSLFPLDWTPPPFLWEENVILTGWYKDLPQLVQVLLHLRGQQGIKSQPALVSTGMSSFLGGVPGCRKDFLPCWGSLCLRSGRRLPFRENAAFTGVDPLAAQVLTGAFVSFLNTKCSIPNLRNIHFLSRDQHSMEEILESEFHLPFDELIAHWIRTADEAEPEIRGALGMADTCGIIFSMDDPVSDDRGPGNYTCPDFISSGMKIFDLTRFRVASSPERNIFELSMNDLMKPSGNLQETFYYTFVRIALVAPPHDTGVRDGDSPTGNDLFDSNLLLPENYRYHYLVDVSGQGVLLRDGGGIILSMTPSILIADSYSDPRSGRIAFSIPTDLIGRIDGGWKFAVMTGCALPVSRLSEGVGKLMDHRHFTSPGKKGEPSSKSLPNVFDVLLPGEIDQMAVLGNGSRNTGLLFLGGSS